ncbi:MAG: GumC family protein, partial [Sedimentisphaerales bacterium]
MVDEIIEVEERPHERSLRDLYYVVFRHKWKMILFFLVIVVIATVYTIRAAKIYRSEAKLFVRVGRESVALDPTATTGPIITIGKTHETEINTELEILKSQELAEKVVEAIGPEVFLKPPEEEFSVEGAGREKVKEVKRQVRALSKGPRSLYARLGLTTPLSDHDMAVLKVMDSLEVQTQADRAGRSSIINASYEAANPKLAQRVLTKLIDFYLEKHITVHRTPGSYQFFTQQCDLLRSKLAQSEKELQNLKNQSGIFSLEEQRGVILGRIGALQMEIDDAEAALAASKARAQVLQEILAKTPELVVTGASIGPNAAVDAMRSRLYELQLLEQDMVSKFEHDSRQVQDVRRQIAAAQALLDKEEQERATLTKGLNATHTAVQSALFTEQATLSSLKAQVGALQAKLTDAQAELKALNDAGVKITALTREIEIQEANYRRYSENLEQARIDSALENGKISNINVVQAATLPIKPVRPRKALNLFLGLFLGTFGGVMLAFFCEYLDHSIKTPDEVEERLRLPTLACIPRVRTSRISSAEKWDIPASIRQHYEAFKEQLLLAPKGSKKVPRVLAITGSHDKEGVSTVAANLAATLARPGDGQVLLIDADLRHPCVHQIFEARLSPGLADVLTNGQSSEAAFVSSPVQNLRILSAGTVDGNPLEMFDSEEFTKLLHSLKKDYRFVVIDLPAVNEASWTVRLARLCDGVGLVVEAERSRWEVVQRTKELLIESNANVLGVVINKRRFYIPKWLYRTL